MRAYELTICIKLKKDLEYRNMFYELSRGINEMFMFDKNLKEFHESNFIKLYTFSGLEPVSKKGYKAGEIYFFKIRTIDRLLSKQFETILKLKRNDIFKVLQIVYNEIEYRKIDELHTLTPSISVIKNKIHWTKDEYDIDILKQRINSNMIKKMRMFAYEDYLINMDENHDFIEKIEQINNKTIVLKYKEGVLLTNKFKIKVKEDNISQKLAFMALGTGLLEKNSLGLGFCISK